MNENSSSKRVVKEARPPIVNADVFIEPQVKPPMRKND